MYKFYINDKEVEEPDGFFGITFSKKRHEKYFGIWGEVGINQGDASTKLRFYNDYSIKLLKREFDKNYIKANMIFEVLDCESKIRLKYKIDFSDYEEDDFSVSVTVRSIESDTMRSRTSVKYSITPNVECSIPTKSLEGTITNEIVDSLSAVVVSSPSAIKHNIPLTGITDVFDFKQSIYKNGGSAKAVDIIGVLKWTAQSTLADIYNLGIFVIDANGLTEQEITKSLPLVTGLTPVLETISLSSINIVLQPYQSIVFRAYSLVVFPNFSFTWQLSANSIEGVVVREHRVEEVSTTHKGILVKYAFEQLVSKMGEGALTLSSDFLEKCNDKFLTNGLNLKGIVSDIIVSFDELFDGINSSDNIKVGINGSVISLERKITKSLKHTKIKGDFDVVFRANKEWMFSGVKGGYNKWTSETAFSNDEINSERNYSTEYSLSSRILDISSNFIASHYLIEKIKRQTDKENASNSNDNELVVVCVVQNTDLSYKAETIENFEVIGGVLYPTNTINMRISPARNLQRHRNYLYLSGDTFFESGTGNTKALQKQNYLCSSENDYIVENFDNVFIPSTPLFGKRVATITKISSLSEYAELNENISFDYNGKSYKGILKSVDIVVGNENLITIEVYI